MCCDKHVNCGSRHRKMPRKKKTEAQMPRMPRNCPGTVISQRSMSPSYFQALPIHGPLFPPILSSHQAEETKKPSVNRASSRSQQSRHLTSNGSSKQTAKDVNDQPKANFKFRQRQLGMFAVLQHVKSEREDRQREFEA